LLLVCGLVDVGACAPKDDGEGATDGADGGEQVKCEEHADFRCSEPLPCIGDADADNGRTDVDVPVHCGTLELFDERGCMRKRCESDAGCDGGQRCYNPLDFDPDECVSTGPTCGYEADLGGCVCGGYDDCSSERGWCVAAEDYPG